MGGDDTGKRGQEDVATKEVALAQKQDARADELHNISLPGFQKAEDYYTKIASGDPDAIYRAISPATQQIKQQSNASKENIRSTTARGGEERLAENLQDVSSTGDIGRLITQSYTGSFPALASLGGQGMGLSINQAANAISGYGTAGKTYANIQASDDANKAATMGFVGQMTGSAAEAAAACWIAEKLYGAQDERTHLVRSYVNFVWPHSSKIGRVLVPLYRRYGIRAAEIVETNVVARSIARVVFGYLLMRARNTFSGGFGLEVIHGF